MRGAGSAPAAAMVLAAGLGKRMRPLTETIPKPMVEVAGRTLIDRSLDSLVAAGVERAVVNIHYLPEPLLHHLERRSDIDIVISDEREALLDSGGGVLKALAQFGGEPFYLLNADTFWLDDGSSNLARLAAGWDDRRMDCRLLLAAPERATGHTGAKAGDFTLDGDGRIARYSDDDIRPLIYAGAGILHPRAFAGAPGGAFSLNRIFDRTIAAGRLFGVILEGQWITVGTPEAIGAAERAVDRFRSGEKLRAG